jgi:DNA-binding XRE family transcriptional regulator
MGTDNDSREIAQHTDGGQEQDGTGRSPLQRECREKKEKEEEKPADGSPKVAVATGPRPGQASRNRLRELRFDRMLSKAEVARRAGVSALTIDRIERGFSCRMDTKRKILEALGLTAQDRVMVFGEDE